MKDVVTDTLVMAALSRPRQAQGKTQLPPALWRPCTCALPEHQWLYSWTLGAWCAGCYLCVHVIERWLLHVKGRKAGNSVERLIR